MKKAFPLFLLFSCMYLNTYAQEDKKIWIDRTGNIIESMGDYLDEEWDGITLYRENNKYGFKNSFGQVILEARYDLAQNVGKGFVAFAFHSSEQDIVWFLFNKGGKMVHGSPFKKIASVNNSENDKAFFYDGLLAIQGISSGKFGCIDTTGHMVIPELYDYIKDLSDLVFYIGKDGKHGIMDKKFHKETLTSYDKILEYSQGLAAVSKKGKWGYINYDGKEVISPKFKYAGYFLNDQASVETDGGAKKVINMKGNFVENAPYLLVTSVYENIMVVKGSNQKSGLFDRVTGKALTGFIYINDPLFVNDFAACQDSTNAFGLVNRRGQVVIKGYDGFGKVSEGMVCVYKNETVRDASGKTITIERSGYMDTKGNLVLPFSFGGLGYCKNGLLNVMKFEDYKAGVEKK